MRSFILSLRVESVIIDKAASLGKKQIERAMAKTMKAVPPGRKVEDAHAPVTAQK
jgi:hypothetical protein